MEDEFRLKKYFKKIKKVVYRLEWIECSKEILNIFDRNDTLDKLRNFLNSNEEAPNKATKNFKINYVLTNYIMSRFYSDKNLISRVKLSRDLENELNNVQPDNQYQYLSNKYSISEDEIRTNELTILNTFCDVSWAVAEFESICKVKDKFKYLVKFTTETDGITEQQINNFLGQIPQKYADYYRLLGPDRIRANSYQESKIKTEWIKIHSEVKIDDEMISEIYGTFKIGDKYGKAKIKSTLKELYEKYNYEKSPKASDLTDYFVLKTTTVLNDGKWISGFEILGKK